MKRQNFKGSHLSSPLMPGGAGQSPFVRDLPTEFAAPEQLSLPPHQQEVEAARSETMKMLGCAWCCGVPRGVSSSIAHTPAGTWAVPLSAPSRLSLSASSSSNGAFHSL